MSAVLVAVLVCFYGGTAYAAQACKNAPFYKGDDPYTVWNTNSILKSSFVFEKKEGEEGYETTFKERVRRCNNLGSGEDVFKKLRPGTLKIPVPPLTVIEAEKPKLVEKKKGIHVLESAKTAIRLPAAALDKIPTIVGDNLALWSLQETVSLYEDANELTRQTEVTGFAYLPVGGVEFHGKPNDIGFVKAASERYVWVPVIHEEKPRLTVLALPKEKRAAKPAAPTRFVREPRREEERKSAIVKELPAPDPREVQNEIALLKKAVAALLEQIDDLGKSLREQVKIREEENKKLRQELERMDTQARQELEALKKEMEKEKKSSYVWVPFWGFLFVAGYTASRWKERKKGVDAHQSGEVEQHKQGGEEKEEIKPLYIHPVWKEMWGKK